MSQGVAKETMEVVDSTSVIWEEMMQGICDKERIENVCKPFYEAMANDIIKQKKRIGGNWAIAQAVFSRNQREFIREKIGSNLVFIVLNMTKECQLYRIKSRHGDSLGEAFFNTMAKYAELCEPAGEDEENAYNVTITENMTRDDVIKKILEIAQIV